MRGELDDTLARLARREEAQRRRAEQLAAETRSPTDEVTEAVQRVVARHPDITVTVLVARGQDTATRHITWSEGQVVAIPVAGPVSTAAIDPAANAPTHPAGPPDVPSWPMSVKTVPAWAASSDGLADDPAARLADLIRRDPSLLGSPDDES
ncbi:hypothetical protein O7627_31015 [Solwaraspora sp. WMMD1047]|uniref:hypothetical protein n=1 Tax=Solwaraspora sp. WMMD1047 TaxID=3016102 RepID=UPI0024171795|nr:hypothetical protein [Solwaraspora sp. WMMD1047]MDG4833710.1 hypothetical protein [Solwaraspora sp. WMMD1047]